MHLENLNHIENKLRIYKELILNYHNALDLMSDKALTTLDDKIADSLLFAEVINKLHSNTTVRILDVGSGVGLPAIPVAITLPQHKVFLTERRQRRASFLKLSLGQLELNNAYVFAKDVKNLTIPEMSGAVRIITAQAVGSFTLLYNLTKHLHAKNFTLITSKGDNWMREKQELEEDCQLKILSTQEVSLKTHGTLIALHF